MSFNPYAKLRNLFPEARLLVGTVIAADAEMATVELPDGTTIRVRGVATEGDQVYVRDGVIEGPAPALTIVEIEV